jgi:hypothetical protein
MSNIITKPRNRLLPETAKQLILLKSWNFQDFKELESFIGQDEGEDD